MWQGRFRWSHTPADPCSQSGPLLLLPCGCAAPMGHADLALTLLQPRDPTQPLSLLPCSGLSASSRKVPEWAVTPSAPGSSLSGHCCMGAVGGGEAKPRALSPHGTLTCGTPEAAVPWEVQWRCQELFCCLQRAGGTQERGHRAVDLVISARSSSTLRKANDTHAQ